MDDDRLRLVTLLLLPSFMIPAWLMRDGRPRAPLLIYMVQRITLWIVLRYAL